MRGHAGEDQSRKCCWSAVHSRSVAILALVLSRLIAHSYENSFQYKKIPFSGKKVFFSSESDFSLSARKNPVTKEDVCGADIRLYSKGSDVGTTIHEMSKDWKKFDWLLTRWPISIESSSVQNWSDAVVDAMNLAAARDFCDSYAS